MCPPERVSEGVREGGGADYCAALVRLRRWHNRWSNLYGRQIAKGKEGERREGRKEGRKEQ